MGVLHTKIVCAGVLLGPNGRLKRAVEQVGTHCLCFACVRSNKCV